jgi:flagellar hook-length control protein FliK
MPGAISLSPTSTPTATTAAAPVAPPTTPTPPLNTQLAPTLFHLRSAEAGTHVLTLTVAPEAVGPVTVRAHVGANGIRIELSAPTAQGRSALDAILPELRRDLSQGGMNSALSLAAPSSDGSASGRSPFDGASFAGDRGPDRSPTVPGAPTARDSSTSLSVSVPTQLRSGATALDVFA